MSHKDTPEMTVRKKAIVRYCNHFLVKERPDKLIDYLPLNIKFFSLQFQDGVVLCHLTEVLSGRIMSRWNSHEKLESAYASNFALIAKHMAEKNLIMEQDVNKLAKGDESEIINLIMSMCIQYQLGFPGKNYEQMKVEFLKWFKTKGFNEMTNFVEDFMDGITLIKLLNLTKPNLIKEKGLKKSAKKENLTQAFKVAEKEFSVPLIVEVEDFLKRKDEISWILYLSFFITLSEIHDKAPELLKDLVQPKDNKRASVMMLSPRVLQEKEEKEDILETIKKSKSQALVAKEKETIEMKEKAEKEKLAKEKERSQKEALEKEQAEKDREEKERSEKAQKEEKYKIEKEKAELEEIKYQASLKKLNSKRATTTAVDLEAMRSSPLKSSDDFRGKGGSVTARTGKVSPNVTLEDLIELQSHGLIDPANIQTIWAYLLSEDRKDYFSNPNRRMPGIRPQSTRIEHVPLSKTPSDFAKRAQSSAGSLSSRSAQHDFMVVVPSPEDIAKILPGVQTHVLIQMVVDPTRKVNFSELSARGTSKPGGPFDIQIKLINAGLLGAYFVPPDYGNYAVAITQKGQHVFGSPIAFSISNKGRGVLPITTIQNMPTVSLTYSQIILTTSSIIFDDGQFDANISSHDIAIRITGPIPTQASVVSFFPEEGSIQFTFTPIMPGEYSIYMAVDGSPLFMESPKITVVSK